jgi:hypothetical protein
VVGAALEVDDGGAHGRDLRVARGGRELLIPARDLGPHPGGAARAGRRGVRRVVGRRVGRAAGGQGEQQDFGDPHGRAC